MKLKDLESILCKQGYSLNRVTKHRIWTKDTKSISVPNNKDINCLLAKRLLKEMALCR